MKHSLITFILFVSLMNTYAQDNELGDIPVVNFEQLQPLLEKQNDTTYIINFWATWCAPCIKEMPAFQKIHDEYIDQKIKVILVSLDFEREINNKLKPYLKKQNITPEVIVLSDPASDIWINKVDSKWTGSIPATLVYNRIKRFFIERELTYDDIENILDQLN